MWFVEDTTWNYSLVLLNLLGYIIQYVSVALSEREVSLNVFWQHNTLNEYYSSFHFLSNISFIETF